MPQNTATGDTASPSPKKSATGRIVLAAVIVLLIAVSFWSFGSGRDEGLHERRLASERLLMDAESLADPSKQAEAYQTLIAAHGSSDDVRISRTVALAMLGRASLLDSLAEQVRLVDAAISRLDKPGGTGEDEANLCHALAMRAELESRPAEKTAILDRVIARFGDAADPDIQGQVARAMWEKAELVRDSSERDRLLDEVVRRYADSSSTNVRWEVAKAMNLKGDTRTESAARNAAYDEVIARFAADRNAFIQGQVVWALSRKAEIAATAPEKLVLYDRIINEYANSRDEFIRGSVERALAAREELSRE